jgi:peptide/nickel transport system substrate-binding protein
VPRPFRSSPVSLMVSLVVAAAASATPRPGGAQEPAPAPIGADDLLRSNPFDRITLIDGTVLIIEPVSPRPLPVYDPKQERERRRRSSEKNSVAMPIEIGAAVEKGKGGAKGADDAQPEDEDRRDELKIHLVQGLRNEARDFMVKRPSIKKIEYFEDLLLEEADRLVLVRDYARAFECCLRVQTRNPGWAGLADHVNHVLFREGSQALIDGDDERGLRLLRELLGRKRDYPGLLDQIAGAYGKRIERALRMGVYARGRRVLHELAEVEPQHIVVRTLRASFIGKAMDRMKEAEAASGPARLDALAAALRIWPTLDGAEARYIQAFAAEPTLDVGVTDVAAPLGPWVHSRADTRVIRLLYRPILAADDPDARKGKYPTQLAAAIETPDLGRRMTIRIRPGVTWSDASRPVSAIDVAHFLIDRSDPHSPNYEARWADMLDRVEVKEETRVEVRLNHAPIKMGGWLLGPVGPAHAGIDGRVASSAHERLLVTSGPYRCTLATDDRTELWLRDDHEASPATETEKRGPHIRRIREVRLPPGQAAITALRRGDVTLLDHVPPDQLAALAEAPGIHVGRYTQPVIHIIALDGRNPVLRNRELRRGLSYAVDRHTLLEDRLLKHPPGDADLPADGPFPKGNYADASNVKPLGFDMLLAKMLVTAARKEIGGGPIKLNLEYPAIPEACAVVGQLTELFGIAGVVIVPLELPESRLETELRAGRRFDLAYRVVRCDDPILDAGTLLCPGYDAPPETNTLASATSPRILQLLLELERASLRTARELAIQIDRESRDELPIIPLWQLADHYAWRDRLKGPGKSADQLYQRLDEWEIHPWIARDPWDPTEKDRSK